MAFAHVGIQLDWQGEGVNEKGICMKTNRVLIDIDPQYFRPTDVEYLMGDATKAYDKLGWIPEITFEQLVADMMDYDLKANLK